MEGIEKLENCIRELNEILRPSFIFDFIPDKYKDYYIYTKKISGLCKNCGGNHGKDYEAVLSKQAYETIKNLFLQIDKIENRPIFDKYQSQGMTRVFKSFEKFEAYRGCQQAVLNYNFTSSDLILYSEIIKKTGMYPPSDEIYLLEKDDYPPDESIFSTENDEVFMNLLTAIALSKSDEAKKILLKFKDDDEVWVRTLIDDLLKMFN